MGKSDSLGQAYVRNYNKMRAFLLRRTGDPDAADELIQEAWLHIADRAEDPSIENPDAWLQTIVVKLSLRWIRKHRFRSIPQEPLTESIQVPDAQPGAERMMQDRQKLSFLRALVDEMPPRRRAVFILYRGGGLSLGETAEQLGISINTVKVQMAEAMEFLRNRMSEAGLWP
jgi:RNA polymerase sigma factor (sigma-70 family)